MSTSKKVSARWDHFTLEDLSVWLEEAYAAGIPHDAYVYTRARPMGKMREVWVDGNDLLSTDPKVKKQLAQEHRLPDNPTPQDLLDYQKSRTDNRPQETYQKWLNAQEGYAAGQPARLQEGNPAQGYEKAEKETKNTDRVDPREL